MSKLIYGVAYNSRGRHKTQISGTSTSVYKTWHGMLRRCYCPKYHARQPTYLGCSVDERFHDFQDFGNWFEGHEYSHHGYQLDKDLLLPNNKVYAPDRCAFIPRQLNTLLIDNGAARGQYPQGVRFHKPLGIYQARVSVDGKYKHLGYFDTPQEAYQVYKIAKEVHVKEKALEWQDRIADNVFQALMNWTLES